MAYTNCKPFNVMTQVLFFYFRLAGFFKEDIACHMAFREPKVVGTRYGWRAPRIKSAIFAFVIR